MISPKHFNFDLRDGVAHITLSRPERINALTFESYRELRDTFVKLKDEPKVRAIVLSGEGERGFCSGGDVEDIIGQLFSRDMAGLVEFTRLTGSLVHAIRTTRAPVIAKLHGIVCGAGAVISLACDMRLGTPDTRFAFLFPKVGLCGADMGAAYLLPRIVGLGVASELLYLGDWVKAPRAERIGLLNEVLDGPALDAKVEELSLRIAKGPAFAHSMTKQMLDYESAMDFAAAIEAEAQAQAICMQHPDFREAPDAWKDKREPRFK